MKINEPVYLGEPVQNACTMMVDPLDGKIRHFFRKGSWDIGFSSVVYSVDYSGAIDSNEPIWINEKEVVDTGPETLAQAFLAISPVSKEILLFFYDKNRRTVLMRSEKGRTEWHTVSPFDDFSFGGICYGHCIWLGNRVICGFHGKDGGGAGAYHSDDDGCSWRRSNRVSVPNLIPDIWQTGSVEPSFIELRDGRVWMLMRTSNDCLYESFSEDRGESWSEARPSSIGAGANSWATLRRLSSGDILLLWNNAMSLDPSVTEGKWSFTNRDVIHAAISKDEGATWQGFRELQLDPLRASGSFVNEPGDKGMNESQIAETDDGNILVTCGQAAGHRSTMIFNPAWLFELANEDDFSHGLAGWSTQLLVRRDPTYNRLYHHNYNRKPGACLVSHPDDGGGRALHVRRKRDPSVFDDRDGAVWNFPAGRTGTLSISLMVPSGSEGVCVALTDRWYQPTDPNGEKDAAYLFEIQPDNGFPTDRRLTVAFEWGGSERIGEDVCTVRIDGSGNLQTLPLRRSCVHGLSYLRFRSRAEDEDKNGLLVDRVFVTVGSG